MQGEDLVDEVIERLHARPDGFRTIVRDMAAAHPDCPARAFQAALIGAAEAIESQIRKAGVPTDEARAARRLALLLGRHIERLQDGKNSPTLRQLAADWRDGDDVFLRP
ncbi:hypothetical protein [Jannaschia aquimarina]|uniref:Uncharacterized protein n=1 Tax=Jannaschia aquimarina TaxID=935700 RepID=A0A0D1CN14_9RHOB|nr:hypothetical protein [Jannaschia aquimarina]KIT16167.1 hypothetical protein jaqu_21290 [Jannaschia aquimarina]SNT36837.1 hypothetical protein SAMN05421775_11314 [Jannaschia aquimarina]